MTRGCCLYAANAAKQFIIRRKNGSFVLHLVSVNSSDSIALSQGLEGKFPRSLLCMLSNAFSLLCQFFFFFCISKLLCFESVTLLSLGDFFVSCDRVVHGRGIP